MDEFLLNTPDFRRLYNCSFYEVDSVPLVQRQQVLLGLALAVISVVEEVLYIPCMVAIWRLSRESACYKMMMVMGVLDMLCLPICGILTGVMGILGTVYCSWPGPIYVLGATGIGLWIAESSVECILAFNRCLELLAPEHVVDRLFAGWRTWAWMAAAVGYGLFYALTQKALIFSGIYFAWFFNPHIGYYSNANDADDYHCPLQSVHDIVVLVTITGTYLFMGLALAYQIHFTMGGVGNEQRRELFARHKMIFVQVVFISVINGLTAFIYDYMQLFAAPAWLTIVSQICWAQAHGFPVVIYLSMNPTIRAECRKLATELRAFFVEKIFFFFCQNGGANVVHPNLFHHTTHAAIHTVT